MRLEFVKQHKSTSIIDNLHHFHGRNTWWVYTFEPSPPPRRCDFPDCPHNIECTGYIVSGRSDGDVKYAGLCVLKDAIID